MNTFHPIAIYLYEKDNQLHISSKEIIKENFNDVEKFVCFNTHVLLHHVIFFTYFSCSEVQEHIKKYISIKSNSILSKSVIEGDVEEIKAIMNHISLNSTEIHDFFNGAIYNSFAYEELDESDEYEYYESDCDELMSDIENFEDNRPTKKLCK